VPEITATDAARNFADLLDAIEHRGEHFTIVRRGRAIAQLDPMKAGRGADVKQALRGSRRDRAWAKDLDDLRGVVELDDRL
jgi:antitoxin (DNA-binding transcriptional repressor) of toxin-antitoxin stability system